MPLYPARFNRFVPPEEPAPVHLPIQPSLGLKRIGRPPKNAHVVHLTLTSAAVTKLKTVAQTRGRDPLAFASAILNTVLEEDLIAAVLDE